MISPEYATWKVDFDARWDRIMRRKRFVWRVTSAFILGQVASIFGAFYIWAVCAGAAWACVLISEWLTRKMDRLVLELDAQTDREIRSQTGSSDPSS